MARLIAQFDNAELKAALQTFADAGNVEVVVEPKQDEVVMEFNDRHLDWIDYVDNKLDKIVGRKPNGTPRSRHLIGGSMVYIVKH